MQKDSAVVLISAVACGLFTLLFLRLGHIQLIQGASFQQQADDNRFFRQPLPASRGLILDRYNEPLVWNVQQYFQVNDPTVLFPKVTPISRDDAVQLIASSGADMVVTRPRRLYRYPKSLAHVIGYVGEVTAEDLQQRSELKPGMTVGKAGLELRNQDSLKGQDGSVTYEVNALGKKQRQVQIQPAQPGQDIQTTLDPYLSEFVARHLGDMKGTVIITDVSTGKILALTSQPAFDANIFSQVSIDPEQQQTIREQIRQLFEDPRKLFFNRAISGAYPPGSVFKLMTALSGLEQDKITEQTEVVDEGTLKVGEYQYGNWYFRQYGRVEGAISLRRAISRSNDIFFYKVAEWVGPDALAKFSRSFGFGERTGVELPAEARGLIPDPKWKETNRGEKWFLGNTYHFGIGQGDVLTTPIQVAQMTQAIANEATLCPLSVIQSNSSQCQQLGVSKAHLDIVINGMVDACSNGGTAFPFFPYNQTRVDQTKSIDVNLSQGAVACKTGTAEFGGADAQGHRRTHGWFTMFATLPESLIRKNNEASSSAETETETVLGSIDQLDDQKLKQLWQERVRTHGFPAKISITVLVESDETIQFKEGSREAAPIAFQVMDWLMK